MSKPDSSGTTSADSNRPHIFLVDGSSYIFRAYHALPPLTRPDGTPVNAVFGFCNMLYKLLEDTKGWEHPTHMAVVFDVARKTFRNDIYADYKAHRPEPPEDLIPQFSLIRDAVDAFNVARLELEGFEADDVIATYARIGREAGARVTIVSSDKDLMQLVTDDVSMLDTMKNKRIGADEVMEKFGVGPDKVIEVQALAGDSSDNIPGVPGIGIKTAALLINEYGDLETLLDRAEEIKQPKRRQNLLEQADLARISKQLVTLRDDVQLPDGLEDIVVRDIDAHKLVTFLDEQNFTSLKNKVVNRLGDDGGLDDETVAAVSSDAPSMGNGSYDCVQDMKSLQVWIDRAFAAGRVAVDTETTSLNAMRAELVGVSLSVEAGSACYIPLGHTGSGGGDGLDFDGGAPKQINREEALKALKPLLQDPGVLKVGQNIKYDWVILARHGIHIAPYDDTMLLSYVLESTLHGHGMDDLAELHLDYSTIKFKEVAGSGKNQVTFDQVPLDKATDYAAEDADITLRLHDVLKSQLVPARKVTVYETLDRPLVRVLAEMEMAGIKVDRQVLSRLSGDFAQGMAALEQEIYEGAGRKFNIASPKQLGEVLFDELGLPGGKKGKTGAYGTGADILEGLAADGHELPRRVLDWRQLAKLKGTYTDALQEQIHPETGRVHTSYALAAVSTGRLASSDPNLQNIPIRTPEGRKIRTAFVAEKGNKLLSADYSQIELRVLAHMADIDALKKAFADGLDIHAMTASEVFGIPMQGMDPADRRRAKAINFGIIYGISAFGLARQLDIPRSEAQDYIDAYFKRFPGIRAYMDNTIEAARKQGYVETLFGRRIHITSIRDKNPARRQFSERAAINAPIQGTAADIIRRAMIHLPSELAASKLDAKMLLQVHDELIFEVPDKQVDDLSALVTRVMRDAPLPARSLSVPLVVEAGAGDNWDQAH